MQFKHYLLLSLVCALVMVCAVPLSAQTSQQEDAPSPPHEVQAEPPAAKLFARRSEQIAPQPSSTGNTAETGANDIALGPYRVTYTLTEMDASKKIGTQHYTFVLNADMQRSHTNLQTHLPVQVGAQYEMEHVGITLDSQLEKFQNALKLHSTLDQTSLADNQKKEGENASSPFPPVTRQTTLLSSALMQENQPMTLWKVDLPGSTHVLEVQAELTRVR